MQLFNSTVFAQTCLNSSLVYIEKKKSHQKHFVGKINFKNHIHVRKVGHTSFLKNNYLLKTLVKWVYKKCKNFQYLKSYIEKKKRTRRYHYFIPVYQKSWYDLQLLRYRVWPTEICNYGSFFALLTPKKSEFWKNEKSCWRYYHFTHVYQKRKSYEVWFLRYGATQTVFCHFGPFLAFLPS